MNKGEFVNYISEQNDCSKAYTEQVIYMFTFSVIDAIGAGTGDTLKIATYNQPKFKVGQKLKDACNIAI